ncbi:MAG: nucleotidyltransferase family protein [Acidobacteriota bacterium]
MSVPAIVLAAGRSSRFGRNKLVQPVRGRPMIHWVLDALADPRLSPIIVVVGFEKEVVAECCAQLAGPVTIVENELYEQGRSSSIRAGITALPPGSSCALVALGDMPFITASLVTALLDAFHRKPLITFPIVAGRKGHPVIFPAHTFPLLQQLRGDKTLHDYLLNHPDLTQPIPWDDSGCTVDIDTSDDHPG